MLTNDQIKSRFAKARKAQVAGKLDEAVNGYRNLIKQSPNLAEAYFNLAEILTSRNAFAEAAKNFEAALKLRPKEPAIWQSYLQLAERHPNTDNLALLVKRSQPVLGHLPVYGFFEGLIAARQKDYLSAVPLLGDAIAKGFSSPRAHVEYGTVLSKLERNEEALSQFEQALVGQPNNGFALARKSELLRDMGRFDEALVAAQAAIDRAPTSGTLYYTYCSIKKVAEDDPIIAKMERMIKSSKTDDESVVFLGHGLAKAMEDLGRNEKVFSYLKIANDANARKHPFDLEAARKVVAEIQSTYLEMREAPDRKIQRTDSAPIFISGLPRSGTTLVEQIISSAANVEGGGELGILNDLLNTARINRLNDGSSIARFQDILTKIGQDFAGETRRRFPDAAHVTDKSINTYAQIGLVKWAIPNAKIVVVRRDPRDNAMSIYKNLFAPGTHRYAASLEGIAQFMRLFEQQVEFWRTHCPEDFYEIRYEDLISDREAQIRRLVDEVGLEWSDSFLVSHKNKRKISTLSATQARQPIYSSSVGAWKKYAAELAPFLAAYGTD